MGKKGPKAVPSAIKAILGRKEKGMPTARKGHGLTRKPSMLKRYKKM
jgi:hypothetical protein